MKGSVQPNLGASMAYYRAKSEVRCCPIGLERAVPRKQRNWCNGRKFLRMVRVRGPDVRGSRPIPGPARGNPTQAMNPFTNLALTLGALAGVAEAGPQSLLIPDSANDAIMEFDSISGALIHPVAIDLVSVTGGAVRSPIEIMEAPTGELWISDVVADTIFLLSPDGSTQLSMADGPLDQCRGLAAFGSGALVANSGSSGGAPGDSLAVIDAAGTLIGSTAIGDPYDVEPFTFNGTAGFLVSDILGEDIVFVEQANHQNQTIFHNSNGILGVDSPQQIHVAAGGRVFVAGSTTPVGIFEYDSVGAQVNYFNTAGIGGVRGVFLLGNGNLLFTTGSGVHIYNTSTMMISTEFQGASGHFISLYTGQLCACNNYCTANPNSTGSPATISVVGTGRVSDNNLMLTASQMPSNSFGYFITSRFQGFVANPTGSSGNLCLSGSIGRYNRSGQIRNSSASGAFSLTLDLNQTPQPSGLVAITAGQSWNFQAWFRDNVSGASTSNFTDGIGVVFF